MSRPRVYGTFLDLDGIRHELSGVIDGYFSKKMGEWDSITTCGKYTHDEPDPNPDNYVTCLKCVCTQRTIVLRAGEPGIIRGLSADRTIIDEAQYFNLTQTPCGEIVSVPRVGATIIVAATREPEGTR